MTELSRFSDIFNPQEFQSNPEENIEKFLLREGKLHLDATRLSDFQKCQRYFYFRHVLGLINLAGKPAPNFGSAIHEFLAEFYRNKIILSKDKRLIGIQAERTGLTIDELFKNAENLNYAWKLFYDACSRFKIDDIPDALYSVTNASIIIQSYLDWYHETDDDVNPLDVEIGFDNIEIGPGVVAAGRMDVINRYAHSLGISVTDHKTTKQLGDKFPNRYKISWQVDLYLIAARAFYEEVRSFMVNVLYVSKTTRKFQRHIFARRTDQLESTIMWITLWAEVIRATIKSGVYLPCYTSCNVYGGCDYTDICESPYKHWPGIIQANFKVDLWDPSNKSKRFEEED